MGFPEPPESTIHGLPNEILSCIFVEACTHANIISDLLHQALPAACVISAVCRRWRMVALSLPAMWAHLTVTLVPYVPDWPVPSLSLTRRVELFLERSRSHPLSLDTSIVYETHGTGGEVWALLFDRCSTCRDLTLRLDCHLNLTDFPMFTERRWSTLEHLQAIYEDHGHVTHSVISLDRFQSALRLRRLSLDSGVIVDIEKSRNFPWASLSTLTIPLTKLDHQEMLGLLPRCENLRSLIIEMDSETVGDFRPHSFTPLHSTTIQHLALKLVRRRSFNEAPPVLLLHSLTLPALKNLEMIGRPVGVGLFRLMATFIVDLCARSRCALVSLALVTISLGGEDLFFLLTRLRHLEKLTVEELTVKDPPDVDDHDIEQPLTKALFSSLLIRPASVGSAMAKNLKRLRLTLRKKAKEEDEPRDEEVRDMLRSRWIESDESLAAQNGVSSIRDVRLRFPDREMDEEMLRAYAPLMNLRGLRFELEGTQEKNAL